MNVKILAEIMESVKPDGWDYFAYKYYSDYNKQKDVNDAFVFELPRDWPLRWDGGCQNPLTFNLWLGKVVGIKPNKHFLETASELLVEAEQLLWRLDQWEFIRITEKPKAVWYDMPEGAIVNAQVWIKIPLTIIAYNTLPDPVPPPFTPPPLLTYGYTVVDELPTTIAEGKIVKYNGTFWAGLQEGESSLPAGTPWPVKGYKEWQGIVDITIAGGFVVKRLNKNDNLSFTANVIGATITHIFIPNQKLESVYVSFLSFEESSAPPVNNIGVIGQFGDDVRVELFSQYDGVTGDFNGVGIPLQIKIYPPQ
jgi:hypothetical protein